MENRKWPQLNLIALLNDHSVEYIEGNNGWINLHCPFCYKGDGVSGLGWNGKTFNCFRCGKLSRMEVLSALLELTPAKTAQALSKYNRRTKTLSDPYNPVQRRLTRVSELKLPYKTTPMTAKHKSYLKSRNFDPARLEAEWGLLGTGPLGEFKHRVIIPIIDEHGQTICYQGRDITGKAKAKYKSCPDEKAVMPIKSCLYGLNECQGQDWIVITEGPTKVWRLGPGSVATFGATVTDNQLRILKSFKRRTIIFDHDEAGIEGADDLAARLSIFGGETQSLSFFGVTDVADISDADAKRVMNRCKGGVKSLPALEETK